MIIGVPKEIKSNEDRIALLPVGVETFVKMGHSVLVEKNGGVGSGIEDEEYTKAGATLVGTPDEIFEKSDMIMKVKEPLAPEYTLLREGQVVFTYFHFAASEELTRAMMDAKIVAIAYETVQTADEKLPLLIPMSEVAGRMAIQQGAKYLEKRMGGRGILLGGVPGVEPARVVILGGGVVGTNAAKMAAGLGANVAILDIDLERLRYLDDIMPGNVSTVMSNSYNIRNAISEADLLVGAVLIPGAKAPRLVTRDMLKLMKPRSVITDVAVDQGGCVETCKPTTHEEPTYIVDDVLHYCVANMPGAVPRTSTLALTNATFPYAQEIVEKGYEEAIRTNPEIAAGVNIIDGKITHPGVSEAFQLDYYPLEEVLG
ncbi:MAG: alanine dehydrogenase [Gemmatimonadota bacterium]|nr:MAG: alanine dehydrogenase [Gemmatimonadota bacterium]